MRREILRLAVPAFLALVAEPLFLLADSAIVGHLGTVPLAALGVASAVLLTAAGVFVFLAYGTTSIVARQYGAGSARSAIAAGVDGLWLAVVLGAVTAVVVGVSAPQLCAAFGASLPVQQQAVTYLRISAAGIPGMLVVLAVTGLLRGLQDTRAPLVAATTGFGANIVLNLVFVYQLGWGIAGSAWGTVIAQTGMALGLVLVVGRRAVAERARLAFHPAGVVRAARGGLPLLVRTLALRAVLLVTTAVAAGSGDVTLAGHQIVLTVWSFLAFALDALAIAAQAITGRALGAGDVVSARGAARTMARWGVVAGLATGVVVLLLSRVIPLGFTTDSRVVGAAAGAFVVVAVVQWLAGYVFVIDGVLMGAGDTVWLAVAMVLAVLLWVPALLLASRGGQPLPGGAGQPLAGLWLWFGAGFMALRGVGLWWRFRSDRWLVTGATR
ncbi:MAG: MATE family efflux transporter [Actinomycetota bacterium]|nr:MATE family efflux transporter [Actinomycetota bacterium]